MRKPFKMDELVLMMAKHLGVCYTCAGENLVLEKPQLPLSALDRDSFTAIADELILELQQSIIEIDLDKNEQIIEKISQENELLAQMIEQHISNFEYEHILNLLPFN